MKLLKLTSIFDSKKSSSLYIFAEHISQIEQCEDYVKIFLDGNHGGIPIKENKTELLNMMGVKEIHYSMGVLEVEEYTGGNNVHSA